MGRVFHGEEQPEELRDPDVDESSDDDDDDEQGGAQADLSWLLGQVQDLVDREEEPEDEVLAGVLQDAELGDADHLAELLPTLQVSIDTRGPDGDSALHLACLYGHDRCAQLLLDAGAKADVADDDDAVPLHDAAAGGYLRICEMLLAAAPAALHQADAEGDMPLHNAARGGHGDVVALLLSQGADPTVPNKDGRTPAQLADEGTAMRRVLEEAEAEAASAAAPAGDAGSG